MTPPNPNNTTIFDILRDFWYYIREFFIGASAGGLGHVANYAHEKHVQKKSIEFNSALFIVKMISGGFIGWLVGTNLEPTTPFRDFIIAIAGITGFTTIVFLDKHGVEIIFKLIFKTDISTTKKGP